MGRLVPKQRQSRLTFLDTIESQTTLLELLKRKKERNVGLSDKEEEDFPQLIALSILSHASTPCTFVNSDGRITRWNIYELALQLKSLRGKQVTLIDGTTQQRYAVEIKDLWSFLERELKHIFPYALEEAIHMSKELPAREKSSSYTFSSDNTID